MNNKEMVGFSSVNENELMNVDGGVIPWVLIGSIALITVCFGVGVANGLKE